MKAHLPLVSILCLWPLGCSLSSDYGEDDTLADTLNCVPSASSGTESGAAPEEVLLSADQKLVGEQGTISAWMEPLPPGHLQGGLPHDSDSVLQLASSAYRLKLSPGKHVRISIDSPALDQGAQADESLVLNAVIRIPEVNSEIMTASDLDFLGEEIMFLSHGSYNEVVFEGFAGCEFEDGLRNAGISAFGVEDLQLEYEVDIFPMVYSNGVEELLSGNFDYEIKFELLSNDEANAIRDQLIEKYNIGQADSRDSI